MSWHYTKCYLTVSTSNYSNLYFQLYLYFFDLEGFYNVYTWKKVDGARQSFEWEKIGIGIEVVNNFPTFSNSVR